MTQAEAVRHLTVRGLDYEEGELQTERAAGVSTDTLGIVGNWGAFAAATAGLTFVLIVAAVALLPIAFNTATVVLSTAILSVGFGGVVVWAVARAARASWAAEWGLRHPDEVDR